jgi:hypothetical protein
MAALLRHIYDLPYDELFADRRSLLRPHALAYIAADKYQVAGLKLAVSKNMKCIIDSYKYLGRDYARPTIDDFLEALRIIVIGTTTQDQLARKVMVEGCIMNLRHLQQQPALTSLLKESADLSAEIIGHHDLECGLSGACLCMEGCNADCIVLCAHCDYAIERGYVWRNRYNISWSCPRCEHRADPKCSECGCHLTWVQRELIF